ncbi:hypothetical protein AO369_1297 [Moraxella catarrhalis]|nr:hypothetical protein AO369_1297 [Moraxella catarrhalis]
MHNNLLKLGNQSIIISDIRYGYPISQPPQKIDLVYKLIIDKFDR